MSCVYLLKVSGVLGPLGQIALVVRPVALVHKSTHEKGTVQLKGNVQVTIQNKNSWTAKIYNPVKVSETYFIILFILKHIHYKHQ